MATNYDLLVKIKADDKQFSKGFRDANNKLREHQAMVKKTGNSYKALNQSARLTANYAKEVGVKHGFTSREFKKASAAASQYANQLRKANQASQSFSKDASKLQGGLANSVVGVAMKRILPLVVIGAVTRSIGKAVSALADYEQKMSQVQAVTGSTEATMVKFNEAAIRISSVTPKTATDVANLEVEMSKLGFSAEETLVSMRSIIDLSVAGFADLGETTQLVAVSLNAFQLSAGYSRDVADTFAYAISNSALTLDKLATALPNVAKGAKEFGLSIQKTTGLLGILADNGIDASKTGTDLRMIFTKLSKEGLTLDEGLKKINESTNKINTAQELFGQRAFLSAIALADQAEAIRHLDEEYSNISGTAEDMADIMQQNVKGALLEVASAWEAFVQNLANDEGYVRNFFTNLAGLINKVNQAMGNLDQKRIDRLAKSIRMGTKATESDVKESGFGEKLAIESVISDLLVELDRVQSEYDKLFGKDSGIISLDQLTSGQKDLEKEAREELEAISTVLAEYRSKLEVPIRIPAVDIGDGDGDGDAEGKAKKISFQLKGLIAQYQDDLNILRKLQLQAFNPEDIKQYEASIFSLTTQIEALKGAFDDLDGAIEKIGDDLKLDNIADTILTKWEAKMEDFKRTFPDALGEAIGDTLADAFSYVGETIGDDFTWDGFGDAMLASLGGTLKNLGTMLIMYGITMDAFKNAFKNPYVAIAAGVAAVAIGARFSKMASKNPTTGGPTSSSFSPRASSSNAGYSRYAGVSGHTATGQRGGTSGQTDFTFKIKGNDLVTVLDRQNRKTQSTR